MLAAASAAQAALPLNPRHPQAPAAAPSRDTLKINDEWIITARDIEGIAYRSYRVDADGTTTVPLAGKVRAAGFTVEQ